MKVWNEGQLATLISGCHFYDHGSLQQKLQIFDLSSNILSNFSNQSAPREPIFIMWGPPIGERTLILKDLLVLWQYCAKDSPLLQGSELGASGRVEMREAMKWQKRM